MNLRIACLFFGMVLFQGSALAELRVPSIFSDHMVLQQGQPVPIWGWAEPHQHIQVSLEGVDGANTRVRADKDGRWEIELPALTASAQARDLVIRTVPPQSSNEQERIAIEDVLVGEVWVCSGQSNMQWTLQWSGQQEIDTSTADHDQLRMYTAERTSTTDPQDDVAGSWVVCNRESAPDLSAVAYYFGRELQRELGVPVGLIHTSWGGSTAEAWTTYDTLVSRKESRDSVRAYRLSLEEDPDAKLFTQIAFDDSKWETTELPAMFKDQGHDIDGSIWYRRHLSIPESWGGRDLEVTLGSIDDADITWFKGYKIGETDHWQAPRKYVVPAAIVDTGPSLLTVRVNDYQGPGGFGGPAEQMQIGPVDDPSERVSLAGSWLLMPSTRWQGSVRPWSANQRPAHLYNGMLHPLVPYGMRGVIWYQGESNVNRARDYAVIFPSMIEDWRAQWGQGDFPFYFVQIAPFNYGRPFECAELRESQAAALTLPATGMVVTMDVGNPKDIHPRAKEPVGHRLALMARKDVYGHDLVARAPSYLCRELSGETILVKFRGECFPLATRDGQSPSHFEIAGENREFHPAKAEIDGYYIRLHSDAVPNPVAARFAWDDDAEPNLIGECGLPVAPFRTDTWPKVSIGN